MTKKTRTILFYTLALIFIIVASIITLSAQGYKFDFEKMEFLQTGGIFVKVYPVGSQVYIDGEPEEKIPSFTRSVLVQNLLPGEYDVKIESKGYYSWEKSLTVEEQKVTDAKNIILFAQDMGFEALKEEIEESWFLNDKILYLKNESFFLYDLKENLEEEVFNVSEGEEFLNLILSKDKNSAIVKTSEGFYLVFLEEEKDPLILSFLNSEASGISLDQGYVTFQVLDQILVRDIEEIETVVLVEEICRTYRGRNK